MKKHNFQYGSWDFGDLSVQEAVKLLYDSMKVRGLDLDTILKESPKGIKLTIVYRPPIEADPFAAEVTAIKVDY